MRTLLLLTFMALCFGANSQNNRVISAGGSSGGGWLKDSLQAGDVQIDALTNSLIIENMDSLDFQANNGIGLISEDIWFSQAGSFTTNWHLSTFNNFSGTGYVNFNIDFIAFTTLVDSLEIEIDNISANKTLRINNQIEIDKYGGFELANFPSSFALYGATDEGKLAYNEDDNVPMFWNGSQWENLAGESGVPSGPQSTLSYVELNGGSPNFTVTTTQSNFTSASFALGDESGADWAHDAANDELDYSGSTGWFLVNYVATGTISSGSLLDFYMVLEENNVTVDGSESYQITDTIDDHGVTFSGTVLVNLSSGDSINLAMYTTTGSGDFNCENMSITAFMLPGQ